MRRFECTGHTTFGAADGRRFFAIQRFDRGPNNQRFHMHTLAGVLQANFRVPDVEYATLLRALWRLTQSRAETKEAFRHMVFNVLCGNRDDHSKNFSFLWNNKHEWFLSPSYDLV